MRRAGSSRAATGESAVVAVGRKPGGGRRMASKWLIHTSNSGGTSPNRTDGAGPWEVRSSAVRPYSPRPVLLTSPPSWRAMSWAP